MGSRAQDQARPPCSAASAELGQAQRGRPARGGDVANGTTRRPIEGQIVDVGQGRDGRCVWRLGSAPMAEQRYRLRTTPVNTSLHFTAPTLIGTLHMPATAGFPKVDPVCCTPATQRPQRTEIRRSKAHFSIAGRTELSLQCASILLSHPVRSFRNEGSRPGPMPGSRRSSENHRPVALRGSS